MASTTTDHLFRLIKSMTKAEKRSFKLYVNRSGGAGDAALFVQLFDVLDKQQEYDEEGIFQKVSALKRSQLSNMKRHLYRQVLTSLRLLHISRNSDVALREEIDFARILYNKGHFQQSQKILDRIKSIATQSHQDLLRLEIIEFEKTIEHRHITHLSESRIDELAAASEQCLEVVSHITNLSNLALKLFSIFVKTGHVKNEQETLFVTEYFNSTFPPLDYDRLSFYEKVHYCQCHVWYYYILQQFPLHFRYTQRWVDLFEETPAMKEADPELYLRGLHSLLTALFYMARHDRYCQVLRELERFIARTADHFDTNLEIQAFTFLYTAKINKHYLEGSFREGLYLVPELMEKLERYGEFLDAHRKLVFYYKIACLYFGSGDNSRAIDYLNDIINYRAGSLLSDIQCYARILYLIAHFELGNYGLLEYLVKSVYRFLGKMEDLNLVQREILTFLRREIRTSPRELRRAFIQLKARLEKLRELPNERRAFLYLDIISWLESKIEGKTVADVISQRFSNR
ncbi:MAG: hypothetical protein RLY31_1795 [Bacteroidota bacterium]|jgi:hypothetical protein